MLSREGGDEREGRRSNEIYWIKDLRPENLSVL
jgi:hypothetical protein